MAQICGIVQVMGFWADSILDPSTVSWVRVQVQYNTLAVFAIVIGLAH